MPDLNVLQVTALVTFLVFFALLLFSWWFLFQRSLFRVIMSFIAMALGREGKKHDAPIETAPDHESLSDAMKVDAQAYTFDDALEKVTGQAPVVIRAPYDTLAPQEEPFMPSATFVEGTAPKGEKRPFRFMRLKLPNKK